MAWIHQQPDWPRFHWDEAVLGKILVQVRYQQGRLLGRMQALGFALRQEASLNTLTSDVVKSSAIEGESLNRDEVRSSIARKLGLDIGGAIPASRHVEGMLDATQSCQQPLTEERLCAWHCALFPTGFSGMYPIVVGAWRPPSAGAMQVVSEAYGRERVHFEAPDANRLSDEMAAFLQWFGEAHGIDPVLKAGLAHFWFVTLHPFEDGNGRIARAIADMALARADESPQRFTACPPRSRPSARPITVSWNVSSVVHWMSRRGYAGFWNAWGGRYSVPKRHWRLCCIRRRCGSTPIVTLSTNANGWF